MRKSSGYLTVATCLTLLGAGTVRHRDIALVFSVGALYYIARFFYEDWKERRIEKMNARAKEAALQKKRDGSEEFAHIVRRAEFLNNMKEIERRENYAGRIKKKADSPEKRRALRMTGASATRWSVQTARTANFTSQKSVFRKNASARRFGSGLRTRCRA